jgi:MerR family transcriptional regulator, light-induced transcriptional regulator
VTEEDLPAQVDNYLGFVLKKQGEDALALLRNLADSKRFALIQLFQVLANAQQEVGSLWSRGAITVADEHYATQVTQEAIDVLANKLRGFHRESRGSALLANFVEGEYHTVGLKMFSELLKADGWNIELFTTSLHVGNIFKHLESSGKRYDLICCSVTMEFNLEELCSILKILRTNIHTRDTTVLVGSHLFQEKRFRDKMIDEETNQPLADFLAKSLEDGIEFVRSIEKEERSKS